MVATHSRRHRIDPMCERLGLVLQRAWLAACSPAALVRRSCRACPFRRACSLGFVTGCSNAAITGLARPDSCRRAPPRTATSRGLRGEGNMPDRTPSSSHACVRPGDGSPGCAGSPAFPAAREQPATTRWLQASSTARAKAASSAYPRMSATSTRAVTESRATTPRRSHT